METAPISPVFGRRNRRSIDLTVSPPPRPSSARVISRTRPRRRFSRGVLWLVIACSLFLAAVTVAWIGGAIGTNDLRTHLWPVALAVTFVIRSMIWQIFGIGSNGGSDFEPWSGSDSGDGGGD